jgi:hypothetical protein
MDLSAFLRYWSLTLAVFVFYLFAVLVASLDIVGELAAAGRKKRETSGPRLDPNPLVRKSVAETLMPGPGQRLDAKREWVARLAKTITDRLGPKIRTVVLEDSKGHPLVHFSDGKKVESYRVDRTLVESAMAGDTSKVAEVTDLLTRHLMADFLGMESNRPPRTTELAREAASKPAPGRPAAPAGDALPDVRPAPAAPTPPVVPAAPAAPAAPATTAGPEMSREERLAAARAKAEQLRRERLKDNPQG